MANDNFRPVEQAVVENERKRTIWNAFGLLPDRWKSAIELIVIDEKKLDEAGQVLGVTDERARMLKLRGLIELRKFLIGRDIKNSDS